LLETVVISRFAGIDTVATALTFTLYHLIANKDKWERLRTEVKKQFSSEDEINYTSVGSLAYLDAVIRESLFPAILNLLSGLRIRPSLVAPFPHLTPPEGMLIDGTFVPGNVTTISHNTNK
jgi:Cytochrome P450